MRRFCLLIVSLLLITVTAHAGTTVRIIEYCPEPYLHDDLDEYVVLSGTGSLDGITVSDGGGRFRFPLGHRLTGN